MSDIREQIYQKYHSQFNAELLKDPKKEITSLKKYYNARILPVIKQYPPDAKILEIGCGTGNLLEFLSENGFKNLTGIDISDEQIKLAKKSKLNVFVADVFKFLESSNSNYDIIFALDFIEHFQKIELQKLFSLVFDSLNREGTFFIRTPNGQGLHSTDIIYGDLTHMTIFNPVSLSQILKLTGFSDIIFFENPPIIKNLKGFLRVILWQIIKSIANLVKIVEIGAPQKIWTRDFYCTAKKISVNDD